MRPLAALLSLVVSLPAVAQVVGEAGAAGPGTVGSAAGVATVPTALSAPTLSPAVTPGLAGTLLAPPAPALVPMDLSDLPIKGRDYTSDEWGKMVAATKDPGVKAVLASKPGDNPSDPLLTVKLKDGETVHGAFRGLADGKMVFETGGKFVGLKLDGGGIAEVSRQVDVMFDGATLKVEDVVVHSAAPVIDPFKDLARYQGRFVDVDTRDLDDLKWSAQTVSGRLLKADGEEIVLEGAKGKYTLSKEFHRVDKVSLRTAHYSSKDQIATIADVAGKVPDGAPVEVVLDGGKAVFGRFFGVRRDAAGPYVLLEVPSAGGTRFRAFRDFRELRTKGFAKGGLLEDSETVYEAPDKK